MEVIRVSGRAGRAAHPHPSSTPAIVPAYYETDELQRQTGDVWSQRQNSLTPEVRTDPFCFLQVADIMGEINSIPRDENEFRPSGRAKEVFAKDRQCKSWYPYNSGLSPKDHFDQMNVERLEESRREWETRLEAERKDFDLKLFNISQDLQRSNQKVANRFTAVMLVLTLVQVWLAMGKSRALVEQWAWELFSLLLEKLR